MDYNRMLEGRRVFVTTGARGIGKAIAYLFARQGATVMIGGKNLSALEVTVKEICAVSPESKGYAFNLSVAMETEETCLRSMEDFGGVDVLVNTVGINSRAPMHEWADETMSRLIETNFLSGMRCARKFLPGMIERGFGSIINISSIHSDKTMPGNSIYAATKGAMNASARAMALDYARTGVRVNTICPGLIMSDTLADEVSSYAEGADREAFLRLLDGMQPLRPGTMEDVANVALFLASDMSAYMTGQTLFLDGGAGIKAHP